MHVICSNCCARYLVQDNAIGHHGRLVQCCRCDHRWWAHTEDDALAIPDWDSAPGQSALVEMRATPDFIIRPKRALVAQPHRNLPVPYVSSDDQLWQMPTWMKVAAGSALLVGVLFGTSYALAFAI